MNTRSSSRLCRWGRAALTLAAVQAVLLAVVHARPGLPAVVLWYVGPPVVSLGSAGLLAIVFIRTALRQQVFTRGHIVGMAALFLSIASVVAFRTFPSSHEHQPSDVRFRLPLDGPVTVAWGGLTRTDNYHAVMPDQRFAYDLLMTRAGRSFENDGTRLEDYYVYGRPALSPADSIVHAVRDGERDEPIGRRKIRNASGNHVILKVALNEFLFIAHLQPGSITVAPGDRVTAGDVLGRVGNSGNTSEPHMHVHLQDTPTPYLGEGIPFYFHEYQVRDLRVERGMPLGGRSRSAFTGQIVEHIGGPPAPAGGPAESRPWSPGPDLVRSHAPAFTGR